MSATIILFDEGKTKEVIEYNDNLYYSDSKLELTLENKSIVAFLHKLLTLNSVNIIVEKSQYLLYIFLL